MAFSTQKEYLHVAYMNERPQPKCVKMEGIKLRTYAASTDERSWSMKKEKQAQFLIDLVACRMYPSESLPENEFAGGEEDDSPLVGKDSLLNVAIDELTRLENLLLEKDDLKSQLQVSQEKLRILDEEHQQVNAILTDESHPEVACRLQKKIEQLKCACKIDKNDENELTKILDAIIKREKSARVLDAQNCYLRRLIEKLSTRCRLEAVPITPEQSTDVNYLQCQVDTLRKEVCLLRESEDKKLKCETASRGIQGSCDDNDAENVNRILAERNALRDKCKNFVAMEGKICQWKHEAEQFQMFRIEACNALKKKDQDIMLYREDIETLQCQIKKMERCCRMKEQEEDNLCSSVDCLRDENRRLREEVCRYSVEMKKVGMLQAQVQCLTTELCEKNCVIEQYDMQFQHLLGVVENLQSQGTCGVVGLQDVHSQTQNEIEELAATTRMTLDHIHKELENRNVVECNLVKSQEELVETKQTLAKSEENLDLANCEMKLLKKEKELQECLLRANNADCMKSLEELKAKMEQMEQDYKKKLEEMEQECKRKMEQLQAEMEKERQAFAKEREEFQKAKADFENQKKAWADEKNKLMASSENEDKLRADFDKERAAWLKERDEFLKEREKFEKERAACAKLADDLNKQREELEKIKNDFDKARQAFDKERADMQREREAFENEKKKLEARAAELERQKEQMEKDKAACEAKAKELADTLSKNEQRRLGADNEMSQLKNQNEELSKQLAECQKKLEDLTKQLTECKNKNEELNKFTESGRAEMEALNKKIAELNKLLEESKNKNDECQKIIEELNKQIEELNKNLKDSQNKNEELNKKLKDCQNEVQAQNAKIAKLAGDIDKLTNELNSTKSQLEACNALVKDISNVKDRNEQLTTVVEAAADADCLKLLEEERRKNAELRKQLGERKHTESKHIEHIEKEIEGHRKSNSALRTSVSKLAAKINTRSAADFERELRVLLDNFTDEICKWRCEKNCRRLTKLQEIAKKICDQGLECLSLKELVYLHQQMCEAAKKLMPPPCGGDMGRQEMKCCKCSGELCPVPSIPKENDVVLLNKLATLERDIQEARENLRKLKKQQDPPDDDEQELETMRAPTYRLNRGLRNTSARSKTRVYNTIVEESYEAPTKDKY